MLDTMLCVLDSVEMKGLTEAAEYILQQHGLSYTVSADADTPSATIVFFKPVVGSVYEVLMQLANAFGCAMTVFEDKRSIWFFVNPHCKTYR